MIAGIEGHLVSTAFLDQQVTRVDNSESERARQELGRWRVRHQLGPSTSTRAMLYAAAAPVAAALGFEPPTAVETIEPVIAATLHAEGRPVALLVTPWGERFDPLWRVAVTEALARGASWCLLFDGVRLRIVDAERLYARRFVQFDLDLAIDHPRCFAALWRTARAAALGATGSHIDSLHALVAASDRHASSVCRSLRDGVIAASADVLGALADGRRTRPSPVEGDTFEQALTIVYRILFLLFAEARALVPLWHPIYRESYSLESLREIAERPGGAPGLWDALRAIARLAHAGCRAGNLRVTPFNGRLFAPSRTPLAERRGLDDEAARRAVLALSTRPAADRAGRERIAYRDLGVEQLGAVYETLLDYEPRVIDQSTLQLVPGSGIRKATGSFYTPQPIADYVVRRTLGPLVHDATPDSILRLRIVDPAMGSGAFLVSACRYLAQAYEQALVRCGHCHPSDLDEQARVAIRRTIAERCLYGVDLNPMAVQLARLSLWLATLAADRPLSFLDHRLQVGDSLLGVWVTDLRRAPTRSRRQRDPLPLFNESDVRQALKDALPIRFSLETTPNDTLEQVRAKERAFAGLTDHDAVLSRWKRVANLWCAQWFSAADAPPAKAFPSLSDAVLTGRGGLPPAVARRYLEGAEAAADAHRFFHWELEFPEVFFDRDGRRRPQAGFDAVIGNPPWEMMRADSGSSDERALARDAVSRTVRFTREAGIYRAQSDGHANRYQLFLERAIALTRPDGRLGLVLPSGLATDQGSAELRRLLFNRCDVDALVGIDNTRGVFPIHRSVRFLLVTASPGRSTTTTACRLGLDDPAALESLGEEPAATASWFPVRVTPALLRRVSGPDLTIPSLRSTLDLSILERAASLFPTLGSDEGWRARFGRELNATEDRAAFRPGGTASLPVVEGKHLSPFRVDLATVRHSLAPAAARRLLGARHERPRLAYRDVAAATNRMTLIAAVLPAGTVSTHTVFCLRTPLPLLAQHVLCGMFNSLVVNYFVRLRVSTHVTTATVERLPLPPPDAAPGVCREIAALARLLARTPDPAALARLNVRVAELYQLTAGEFEHILGTFPLIPEKQRTATFELFVSEARR